MKIQPSEFRVIDLFSGCGGLSLGLKNAGFNVVAGFDNWKLAIDIYRRNLAHQAFVVDLSNAEKNFKAFKEFEPDIIAGGPPCQDFSSAGKRDEGLGRGDLTTCFASVVAAVKPEFFIMENVDRFMKSKKYNEAKMIFQAANYGLTENIIDANFCGVPQRRKRFFWIGELNGKDKNLEFYLKANLSAKRMTVRQYFSSLGKDLDIEHYYRHPRSYKRRGVFSIDEPSPTIRGVNRPIPKTYKPHPGDSAAISPVIRPLSTLERSYLQTFPENFIFEGSKTDIEQMIGNAVPVKLAEYVARCLAQYITNYSEKPSENLNDRDFQANIDYAQLSLF